jgi:AraC family transcriptional regulator
MSWGDLVVLHTIEPPSEIEMAPVTHHLMSLLLKGGLRQVTRLDGQEYVGNQNSGDFWLQPFGCPGSWAWEGTDKTMTFCITPLFLERIATETNCLNSKQVELLPIVKNHDPQIESIALSFLNEMNTEGLGGKLYTESLANLFAIHLLRHYCAFEPKLKQYQGGLPKHKLQQAIDYIQANLDQKLTLEAIAQHLNMSVYHFCDLFKQSVGIAPYKYVLQQRVERAKQLLKDEERAIVDIALECGFANQTHLNKHFRKFTGMTPNSYRHQ